MAKTVFDHLHFDDGIWYTDQVRQVSYPKEGNAFYFELESESFWFQHRNKCIINLVQRFSANDLFFDIGGGNGFVSSGLQNADIKVVLVEPGDQGAFNAKKRGLNNVICGNIEDIGINNNSIPSAGLFDVIEHIEDDMSFLNYIKSKLVNGGLLYITVPAYSILWSKDDRDAGHFRRYKLSTLEKNLRRLEFEIVYSTYMFSPLPIPIFIMRTLPSLINHGSRNKDDAHKREHKQRSKVLSGVLDWEYGRISKAKSIPFGSSCLLVARK